MRTRSAARLSLAATTAALTTSAYDGRGIHAVAFPNEFTPNTFE